METSYYLSDLKYTRRLRYEPNVDYLYRPFYQPNMDYVYKPIEHPGIDYLYKPKDDAHFGFLYEPIPDYLIPDRPPYRDHNSSHQTKGPSSSHSHSHSHSHCKCSSTPSACNESLTLERKSVAKENIKYIKRFPFLVDKSHVETITDAKYQKISRKLGVPTNKFSTIYVEKCTSFEAIMSAHKRDPQSHICVLNCANPITPGGDYLDGQSTQEASLCRHTLLYPTLEGNAMYTANEIDGTDTMIYSPDVSVFRDAYYKEMVHPFRIDVISATPVDNRKCELVSGPKIMDRRIRKIIHLAAAKKADVLILGAFGCGALKNDPKLISNSFYKVLVTEGLKYHFSQIIFAVSEDPAIFDVFRKRFNEH